MSKKRYTEEFKIEAVRQVVERGYSIVQHKTTYSTDVSAKSYRRWKFAILLTLTEAHIKCR